MDRRGSFLLCSGFILALVPASLWGQEILVQVLASESQEPIPTAFISLLDESGDPVLHALTDSQGRASFSLPEPGTYNLRAEMFGRATALSPLIHLLSDSTAIHVFELEVEAIPISGIRVDSEQRCRIRPQDGQEIARVWEEVRKALSIQTWTDEVGVYRFQIVAWERDLDRDGRTVESEALREFSTIARNPIQSVPVDSLMSSGFIQGPKAGDVEYFGPDASILLSNLFLNTHCFRLVEDEAKSGDIGLAFEPMGKETPDIEGTIWLNRETAHLLFLEFRYANAPDDLTEGVAGGRVDFERLSDGAWIVRRWWIRMPIRDSSWVFGRKRLVGIHETGQVVSEITPLSGTRLLNPEVASETGRVDDTQQAPGSARALRQAQELVLQHYDYARITGRFNPRVVGKMGRGCDGASLQDCMQGDWSCLDIGCPWGHDEDRVDLIPKLEELVPVAGNSEWLFRQRVGFAIKNDEMERADTIAHACPDGEWWCQTLRGLTAHLLHPGEGLVHFDSAFALVAENPRRLSSGEFAWGMGPEARCQWSDIRAVAPLEMLDEVRPLRCPEAEELSTRFWRLADPLWTRDGNERYVEHLARQEMIRMDIDVQDLLHAAALEGQYEIWKWESHASYEHVLREGFPNSNTEPCWDVTPPHSRVGYACMAYARETFVHGGYSFAPDEERFRRPLETTAEDWAMEWHGGGCQPPWNVAGCGRRPMPRHRPASPGALVGHDGCQPPWKLEDCGAERMITRERWHNLDHQTVAFRREGQLLVMSAARVPEELGPRSGLEPALALGRVETLDLQVAPALVDEARVFRAMTRVDTADYLASIEVVGQTEIGRARFGAPAPPLSDGFGVSDLALLHPLFESGSIPLEQALLPSTEVSGESHVGLYFEVYGLEEDESVEFTLTAKRQNESFLHGLASLLGLTSAETPHELTWGDPREEEQGFIKRFFNFNLANLDKGEYEFTLKVLRGDGEEASVSRRVTIR